MPESAIYQTAHRSLGSEIFKPPISHDARELLEAILIQICNRGTKIGGSNPLLQNFAKEYSACLYEDAILGWPHREIRKRLNTLMPKARDDAQMLHFARLVPLFSKQWNIDISQSTAYRFSRSVSQSEIYDFLTQHFLIDDFSRYDLIKLSEIARKPIDTIRDICKKLDRPEQRSITYLYRVINHEIKEQEVVAQHTDRVMQQSMERLKQILDANNDPQRVIKPLDRSWVDDVEITREMERENGNDN